MVSRHRHVGQVLVGIALAVILIATSGCRPSAPQTPTHEPAPNPDRGIAIESPVADSTGFRLVAQGLPDEGMWKCHPAVADVNRDGRPDLAAIARKGDGPHVWLNDGGGAWQEASQGIDRSRSCGGGLAFGDVNGDGLIDLAIADHCFGITLYFGDGDGHWKSTHTNLDLFRPESDRSADNPYAPGVEDIALGDFDNDGDVDLVVGASGQGGVRAFRNDGDGMHWTDSSAGLPMEGFANTVLIADVNRDGLPDIVAAHEEGPRVWLGNGGSFWQTASEGLPIPTIGGLYYQIGLGDVNEDSRVDLVAANWVDGVELFVQATDGTWEKRKDVFPEMRGGAIGIGLADLDGDDHLDIAVTGRESLEVGTVFGIFVLRGDGSGAFKRWEGTNMPETGLATTWCVAFGDMNLDGVDDLIAATGGVVARSDAAASSIEKRLQVWCAESPKSPTRVARKDNG